MRRILPWGVFIILTIFGSCKKSDNGVSSEDNLKDQVLQKTRDNYLWHDQIPSDFNPRVYSSPESIMTAIQQFSNEPGFIDPVDHYSFAMKKTEWDNISSGVASDFGLNVFFMVMAT